MMACCILCFRMKKFGDNSDKNKEKKILLEKLIYKVFIEYYFIFYYYYYYYLFLLD